MGKIRDQFADAFRDFNSAGVPASGHRTPPKPEIRAIGVLVEAGIAAAATANNLPAAAALIAPLLASAQAAQAAADGAQVILGQALDAIPASVADQLDTAVAEATAQAEAASGTAELAAGTALAGSRYFATRSAGEAGSVTDQFFSTDDGAGSLIFYRRTSTTSAEIGRAVTPGALSADTGADRVNYKRGLTGEQKRSVGQELDSFAVSVERFGAVGDGTTDDTAAIRAAFTTGRSIRLTQGKTYLIKSRLLITGNNVAIGGGGTLKFSPDWNFAADTSGANTHFRGIFIEGNNVTFDGVIFDATGVPGGNAVENGFIWSTALDTSINDCQFIGNPKGTCVWGLAARLTVQGCKARACTALAFARGPDALISNNTIINATDAAIALNGLPCVGAAVVGNVIHNELASELPAMIAVEEGASEWAIVGNTMRGASGGGIWCGNVLANDSARGGVIANNVVSVYSDPSVRPSVTNPGSLLYVSPYYVGTVITGNKLIGAPSGNVGTRMAIIPATGTLFSDNYLEGSGADGIDALVGILAGTGGITISNNRSLSAAAGRHYLFTPGDYGLAPCIFTGGEFLGGAEAINSELQAGGIANFRLYIENLHQVTATAVVNATTAIGDRGAFLNAGGAQMPHKIGVRTEMYCNAAPGNAGLLPFQNGDRFNYLDPAGAGALAIVKVAGGTPWQKFGGPIG